MTAVDKLPGQQLYVKIGDGNSPEVFAHPCLINGKRGIKFTSDVGKTTMPDCQNPDDPAWKSVQVDGLQASVDGAGKLDNKAATISAYHDWWKSGGLKNAQVWLGTIGYWEGAFALTTYSVDGERKQYADVSIALESDGPVNWVTAP